MVRAVPPGLLDYLDYTNDKMLRQSNTCRNGPRV